MYMHLHLENMRTNAYTHAYMHACMHALHVCMCMYAYMRFHLENMRTNARGVSQRSHELVSHELVFLMQRSRVPENLSTPAR